MSSDRLLVPGLCLELLTEEKSDHVQSRLKASQGVFTAQPAGYLRLAGGKEGGIAEIVGVDAYWLPRAATGRG